ncbi:Acetyltransferase YpeA [Rathayibacter tanaceti]|uniref:Acetyltransferase YpeA n=1 Tax=Rathayibacter tanaceti TaxID=1671680 RepID=A0A162GP52_9MICO|nr:Acetyltransferase YpeA [Rathayibacter tanaceti]
MTSWRIRDHHSDDVDGVLRLWEQVNASEAPPVYSLAEVLASCAKDHAVVAVVEDRVVGAAVGRAAHAQGWVVFLATAPDYRERGIGSALLAALEARMAPAGISKLSALMPAAETRVGAFLRQASSWGRTCTTSSAVSRCSGRS